MNTGDRGGKQLSRPKFWAIYENHDNKILQRETSYLKATYNIATICRIYEKKGYLKFCHIMFYNELFCFLGKCQNYAGSSLAGHTLTLH